MTRYIIKRLLIMIPTLILVACIIFLVVNAMPGDPALTVLGAEMEGDYELVKERMGLNGTIWERLWRWLSGVLQGDLGESYFLGTSVWDAIKTRIPVTVSLATAALVVAVIIGIPLGIIASLKPNSALDTAISSVSLLGLCTPEFFGGLTFILLFAIQIRAFPSGGYKPLSGGAGQWAKYIFLPAFTYGFKQAAYFARLMRSSMLEVLNQDFITTATAKGQKKTVVIMKHALRNALLPIVTGVGMTYTMMLGGAFITESLFRLPGTGLLIINSIAKRDFPVVCGTLLLISAAILIINLLVDILYAFIDPRVRFGKK
ncbi:aBC-type dipeptide/oligopeptide/nickel transport system permease component [Clostridium sp. CAG:1024]|nr:aBC-type dipeptide/oligopeptide/nickel transport system permease component [Clostridium sp. CAG:1024]